MIYVDAFLKTALMSVLALAAVRDIRKKAVTAGLILICALTSVLDVILLLCTDGTTLAAAGISLIPGVIMLLISKVTGQGLGYGDGLMALCVAPALGIQKAALGLILAVFLCGILSMFLLVLKKAKGKTKIPFLPFMAVGMGVMAVAQI